jgi:hypothetical protein
MQFLLSVISSMLLLLHLSLVENDVCGFQGESDRGFRRCQVSLSPGLTQKESGSGLNHLAYHTHSIRNR